MGIIDRVRIYFDTEFTKFRGGQLLSAGFVADDDRWLYVEFDEPARSREAGEFCQREVLSQFGLYPHCRVRTDDEAGRRIAQWLLRFEQRLTLSYDYKLDWYHLETVVRAAGQWDSVRPLIEAQNIAGVAAQESAVAAQESYFQGCSWPGRHHALIDAYALRERWREYRRLAAEGDGSEAG